jgi:hypothetical protein
MRNISGTRERALYVSFVPLSYIITELNKPYIIKNGGELSNLEYLPTKQTMQNISRTRERAPLVSFVSSSYIIPELNKPYIIKNGGELSNLEYLPTKTESAEYLMNAGTRTFHLFCPYKLHNTEFKKAQLIWYTNEICSHT